MIEADKKALALAAGLREVAFADFNSQFPDDDSISVGEFLAGVKAEKPHWFAPPIERAELALSSLKEQGELIREIGEAAASEVLAQHGLKIGQIKPPAKAEEKIKGEGNPYAKNFKGTPAEREAKIASIIRSAGTKFAASLAKSAGVTISGQPLRR
jgi:hypothetical protein